MAPFIRSNNSKDKLLNSYFIALIPLIIYGFYKAIIYNYFLNAILNLSLGILISFIIEIFYQKFCLKKAQINFKTSTLLFSIMLVMLIPPLYNYLVFSLIILLSLIISKIFNLEEKINIVCIIFLILVLASQLLSFTNLNYLNKNIQLSFLDLLMGRGVGGIFTTSNLCCLISYFILRNNQIYKKEIPFYVIIFYLIFLGIYNLISFNYHSLELFLSGYVMFSAIFIAPLSYTSPYTKKGQIIYSFLISLISFILITFFNLYYGIFIAILGLNLFHQIIDKKWITSAY